MSDATTHLLLPYILAAQAQKHVTHNEALRILDGLVQLSVLDRDLAAPPGSPADGDRYIVASGATGDWAGWDLNVALWTDGAWLRLPPRIGWLVWVADEAQVLVWTDSGWVDLATAAGYLTAPVLAAGGILGVGVNTGSDETNRLAVASPATLLTHEGADHRLTINKAAAGDTASLLFQTGWSGRAEMGTAGIDDFAVKVSADGEVWHEGMVLDRDTGQARFPGGAEVSGALTGTAVTQSSTDATAGRLMQVADFGLGATSAPAFIADLDAHDTAAGFYGVRTDTPGTRPQGYSNFGFVLVFRQASTGIAQIYINSNGQRMAYRAATSGTWNSWRGLDAEHGANANGAYVRFPDGTQICTHEIALPAPNNPLGASFIGNTLSWTYPAAFSGGASVSGHQVDIGGTAYLAAYGGGNTSVTLRCARPSTTDSDITFKVAAIGRWF